MLGLTGADLAGKLTTTIMKAFEAASGIVTRMETKFRVRKVRKNVIVILFVCAIVSVLVGVIVVTHPTGSNGAPGPVLDAIFFSAIALFCVIAADRFVTEFTLEGTQLTAKWGSVFTRFKKIDLNQVIAMNAFMDRGAYLSIAEIPKNNVVPKYGEFRLRLQDSAGTKLYLDFTAYDKAQIMPFLQALSDVSKRPGVKKNTLVDPALERWGFPGQQQ